MVRHDLSADIGDDADRSAYQGVLANMQLGYDLLAYHFPTTIVLPTFGNNDARYHDAAIDEDDKEDYYTKIYEMWFSALGGN